MNNIEILEERINFCKNNTECREQLNQCFGCTFEIEEIQAIENLIKENKELKEKLEEKEMQHELELIGKEEYTKDAMGEIIEHYYTANEDCIPKSKIKEKIEEYNIPILDVLDKLPIMPRTIERGCGAKDGIIYVLQELLEEGE